MDKELAYNLAGFFIIVGIFIFFNGLINVSIETLLLGITLVAVGCWTQLQALE